MSKKFTEPSSKVTDKSEIIRYAKQYMRENHFMDMYWFVYSEMKYPDAPTSFIRDIAYKMIGSGRYQMAYTNNENSFQIIRKNWVYHNPIFYGIIVVIAAALLSLLVAQIDRPKKIQLHYPKQTQQDSQLNSLAASLKNLEKRLTDSIAILRNDTPFLKNNR